MYQSRKGTSNFHRVIMNWVLTKKGLPKAYNNVTGDIYKGQIQALGVCVESFLEGYSENRSAQEFG